ncbi:MAG: zinc ribbon domain-containing protein [Deltaproteobacteria bacterium]|nr:zinc ribbon domain-containing protein [Deltaproteobacteria bacterium]
MPIFEYHCANCEKLIEKIQRCPLASIECPTCGKPALRTVSLPSAGASSGGACSAPGGSGFT